MKSKMLRFTIKFPAIKLNIRAENKQFVIKILLFILVKFKDIQRCVKYI